MGPVEMVSASAIGVALWKVKAVIRQYQAPAGISKHDALDQIAELVEFIPQSPLVLHLLEQMRCNPRLAWMIGPGSETYELLTAEVTSAQELPAYRRQFEAALSYEPWPSLERLASDVSNEAVEAWARRHGIGLDVANLRAAFEDATTLGGQPC